MKIECRWQNGMILSATNGQHTVEMDSKKPFGTESQMSPKDLVVAGLCGCTAMDIVGLMRKHKQEMTAFEIVATVKASENGHPIVFKEINMLLKFTGNIDPEILLESVRLSQTKYCGVSAMLSKALPITYRVELNEREIGSGHADFDAQ